MPFIRSISGLRATLGDSLHPSIISNNIAAFDKILPKGIIFIGRDGRPSGEWIEQIVAGTLAACGRDVVLLGVVPTPTVQLSVEHDKKVTRFFFLGCRAKKKSKTMAVGSPILKPWSKVLPGYFCRQICVWRAVL